MKFLHLMILTSMLLLISCESEHVGPETNCVPLSLYDLDYHYVTAAKVYDIRKTPPKEIRNGTIENNLYWQWVGLTENGDNPPPYNHYFIYTAFFDEPDESRLHFTNVDFFDYKFERNDCQVDFFLPGDTLHAELINGGSEIAFDRYAIYDHSTSGSGTDTFTFIEFMNQEFKSYEEIIFEFARDNKGKYDTIGIELVSSRTRE